jgi:outer membrane protein assembly factor BamE (lipoprotein component of BamABCDE complex)
MFLKGFLNLRCSVLVMHLRYPAVIPAALAAFLVSCSSTPAPSTPDNTASSPTVAAVGDGPEHALQKGMTAEAVKQIMGNPAEIKLMTTTTGKAEVWVYRRTSSTPVRQVQVGTRVTTSPTTGDHQSNMGVQTVDEPVFAQLIEVVDETVSLLMFDDKLVEQKTTAQRHLEYK